MLGKVAPKRRSGRGSFVALQEYLGADRDDCLATWSHGTASHETAALEMEAIVSRSGFKGDDPVYHVILSFRPGEIVDVETAKLCEAAARKSLGAEGHQSFAAFHHDAKLDRYHLHLGINKVSAETGRTLNTWGDFQKLARASEWCEREYGLQIDRHTDWRTRLGERDFSFEMEQFDNTKIEEPLYRMTTEANSARARAGFSWAKIMRTEVGPAIQQAAKSAVSWRDIHAASALYGVNLERVEGGYKLSGAEIGQHVKLSELGISGADLEAKLGPYKAPLGLTLFADRVDTAKKYAAKWTTWTQAHADLKVVGLAIEALANHRGRIVDLKGDNRCAASVLGESIKEMEARMGPYEMAPEIQARLDRDLCRRADGLASKAAILADEPKIIINSLSAMRSTWDRTIIEREVAAHLGLGNMRALDPAAAATLEATTDAVLEKCAEIDPELGIYTTTEIVAEERAMFAAAQTLVNDASGAKLRGPGNELDEQQRQAFRHLATPSKLAIVTGVAGAGKSRLQRDLCAAYAEAGVRVIGVAVSCSAAKTLGEEAEIKSCSVAKLLYDLETGKEKLTTQTAVFIDEAGMLGSSQARQLFSYAAAAGATVRMLGDEAQHESVTRGAVLRGLVQEHGALDMATTRRSRHEWQRTIAENMRQGRVGQAFDALRERGRIQQYDTTAEAKEYLVRQYVASRSETVTEPDGTVRARSGAIYANTNEDVRDLNLMAQQDLKPKLGVANEYDTADGLLTIHVGDFVAIRESNESRSGDRWLNGDRAEVIGHDDRGRLVLKRERDGVVDVWDVREKNAVQLGYAMTSHRSQGATVDDTFLLGGGGYRSQYVGLTRARDRVTVAIGRDRVSHFGEMMYRASQDNGKTLVRDAQRIVADRMDAARATKEIRVEQKLADGGKRHIEPPRMRGYKWP